MKRILKFNGKVGEIKRMFKRENLGFVSFDEKVRGKRFNSVK